MQNVIRCKIFISWAVLAFLGIAATQSYVGGNGGYANITSVVPKFKPWREWSTWSQCDVSCGGVGMQERVRKCRNRQDKSSKCFGREIIESRPCGDAPCGTNTVSCDTVGTVTDSLNIPLEGVEICLGSIKVQKCITITHTNEEGFFSVEGICADSEYAHLLARKNKYVTTRIRLKVNETGRAFATVKLLELVKPTIYYHPESKSRMIGQSVKFCCKARGSTKDHLFTWYHNGNVVDANLYSRDPGTLEIRTLRLDDAGEYWCKVSSKTSFAKTTSLSQTAVLSVFESEQNACDEKPGVKLIRLPNDCSMASSRVVQRNNKTYFDVGMCSSVECPAKYADISEGCGETMADITCCGPSERKEINLNCRDFVLPIYKTTKCGCQECVKPVIKVRGRAYGNDPITDPLRYGYVERSGKRIGRTSYDGGFTVNVPHGSKRLVLTFIDRFGKLMTTTKVVSFKEDGGVTFHDIKMPQKSPEKSFGSQERSVTSLNGVRGQNSVAQIVTAPNGFVRKDGKPYTGKVRASVTFIDPRNETSYQESPTDLAFIDDNGESLPLQTYGMFEMDFRDEDLNELNVANAKIVLDQNQMVSTSHARKLKLWSLNLENGMWEEEENFKEMEIEDEQVQPGPKRKKREAPTTFFVGNLEVRERRLYNLDVPVENRCWLKVRAYRSPDFDPNEQVEGVDIVAINMEPKGGFRGNPSAWGRFDSTLTSKYGACVRVFCHEDKPDVYKAIVTATLDSSEELYAAPSGHPVNPKVVGVQGDILRALDYRRSDHSLATGKKTSFQINLPKPRPEVNYTGPIYPEENYAECVRAPVTDNHFRFYRTEDFLYEYNTVYMDEHNCITWTPHYLNWWPKPLEYRACYIKVHVSGLSTVIRAKSMGGTHPETRGKLYGIRDDRSVLAQRLEGPFIGDSAACIEFKCSGKLYDMEEPDRTLVSVIPQGECQLHRMNGQLSQYLTEHPPAVEGESASEFRMYAPPDPLGHNYGIYTVTDDDPLIAKKTALGRCYAGSSDTTSRIMHARKGVAIYYWCTDRNGEIELP
uniref:cartilage intermediate layer protein 1-like n=1 Tax=Styela clava TaxID=7725 RepID=UPI00193A8899|nr:cartilage intermediate layer protein 1-like [Styela clava]